MLQLLGLWWESASGGGAPDTEDPSGSITYPAHGETLTGTVTITVSATDNVAVDDVEFFVDAVSLGTDATAPYTQAWDTTLASEGWHVITALITDTSANDYTTASITVFVDNIPAGPSTLLGSNSISLNRGLVLKI